MLPQGKDSHAGFRGVGSPVAIGCTEVTNVHVCDIIGQNHVLVSNTRRRALGQ